jgi:hypothetical protein
MGFFKKVFKGIGKVFRKIGRGIKKVVGKIGKFMGKIGIVGQIALGFLLPGVGQVLGNMLGNGVAALAGSSNAILSGAGKFIQGAIKLGTSAGKVFSTITEGVTKVIGETVGTFANELGLGDITKTLTGGKIDITNKNFGNLFERTSEAITNSVAGVKEAVGYTVSEQAATQLAQKPLEAVSSDLTEKLTGVTGDTSFGVEDVLQPIEVTAQRIPTAPTSLLEQTTTAIKELPENMATAGVEMIEKAPEKIIGSIESGIESTIQTGIAQAAGIKTTPEYNVTNISGYVPTIDLAGTSDIGASAPQFDAVGYMANNTNMINMNPYGYNANIYNQATYQNRMREYGYA